ncbi:hypothetical protein [Streptomyces nitrosporeus]|uniref:hypothetical protein n=1 Tax=Streptomyces nitrosporeus TaxID=28894 RepID=UPI00123DF2FF|nr:hypothetical protein [Streptomyces nitrosporeus]
MKTSSGTLYGNIYVYYDSSTGRNCAVTVKNSTGGYGSTSWTSVTLAVCKTSTAGSPCYTDGQPTVTDGGYYKQYAGPVSVSAAGKCIKLFGQISADTPIATGQSPSYGVHCG